MEGLFSTWRNDRLKVHHIASDHIRHDLIMLRVWQSGFIFKKGGITSFKQILIIQRAPKTKISIIVITDLKL